MDEVMQRLSEITEKLESMDKKLQKYLEKIKVLEIKKADIRRTL